MSVIGNYQFQDWDAEGECSGCTITFNTELGSILPWVTSYHPEHSEVVVFDEVVEKDWRQKIT